MSDKRDGETKVRLTVDGHEIVGTAEDLRAVLRDVLGNRDSDFIPVTLPPIPPNSTPVITVGDPPFPPNLSVSGTVAGRIREGWTVVMKGFTLPGFDQHAIKDDPLERMTRDGRR